MNWIKPDCCSFFRLDIGLCKCLLLSCLQLNFIAYSSSICLMVVVICAKSFILIRELNFWTFYSSGFFGCLAVPWLPENQNCCRQNRNFHLHLTLHFMIIFICFDLVIFCLLDLWNDLLKIGFKGLDYFTWFDWLWYLWIHEGVFCTYYERNFVNRRIFICNFSWGFERNLYDRNFLTLNFWTCGFCSH